MAQHTHPETDQTLRLSLRAVVLGVALLFGIGILGGFVGQQLIAPPVTPLSSGTDRIVSTVQEVTISPNTAAAQVVSNIGRSVVVLATISGTQVQPQATATVITNDGLLVTTAALPDVSLVALDDTGAPIALDRVGVDALYGISYWRMPKSVVAPLDVRRDPLSVGTELLGVSRSEGSRQLKVIDFRVQEFSLPRAGEATGWQRLILGSGEVATLMPGAPLVDEEGRLAGLVLDAEGRAVGVDVLDMSLRRLGARTREFDPLDKLGLNIAYSFGPAADDATKVVFTPTIVAVAPGSPAASALLQRGDRIVTIGETTITWETNVAEQLSAPLPLKLTLRRGEEVVSAMIQATPTP